MLDRAQVDELFELFEKDELAAAVAEARAQAERLVAEMEQARDFAKAAALAHRLKGLLLSYAGGAAARIAERIEEQAQAQGDVAPLLSELKAAVGAWACAWSQLLR